jgi:hypothetical protein
MSETDYTDIGCEHSIKFVGYKDDPHSGLNVLHKNPTTGEPCEGFIAFAGGAWANEFKENPIIVWEVQSFEPLTCSPSLLCSCGDHGFIQNGRWVLA